MILRDIVSWDRSVGIPIRFLLSLGYSLRMLREEINSLFQNFFCYQPLVLKRADEHILPSIDIFESKKNYKVKIALPGLDTKDFDFFANDGFLTLKGENRREKGGEDKNYIHAEVSCGSFQRSIAMPERADCDKAEAHFKNGMLVVEIPKKAEAIQKPRRLQIKKSRLKSEVKYWGESVGDGHPGLNPDAYQLRK